MTEEELTALPKHGVQQYDKKFLVATLEWSWPRTRPMTGRAIFYDEIPAPSSSMAGQAPCKQSGRLKNNRLLLSDRLLGGSCGS